MKMTFIINLIIFFLLQFFLLAQKKTIIKYNELFKQYEYYDSYGKKNWQF